MALKFYSHYSNRILPISGGMMEQPNRFIEWMEVVESALNEPKPKGNR